MRFRRHVFVCENVRAEDDPRGSCGRKGSGEIRKALEAELKRHGLAKQVRANASGRSDGPTRMQRDAHSGCVCRAWRSRRTSGPAIGNAA